jgi:Fur family ferric uptake transcriptional regulator
MTTNPAPDQDAGSPAWVDRLRERGFRITPQRHLILQAVDDLGHATPEEIHVHVQQRTSGVNLSTVYRTLEVLEGVGLVTHAHISHGSPTYHSVRDQPHVHLVCRSCESVDSVPAGEIAQLVGYLHHERGFTPDLGHLTVHGVCRSCSDDTTDPKH